ncbi:hypothetical protein I5Q82_07000 [Acutalibacter muris]|uniref:Uncharacterized protein n=1 Tax=Acutalibacter muris TaxID=1796620 RepID=A0A1Z2XUM2_9FIRM|nr:hypothetical protein [Acutalibacter muris]ANU54628.1 hypothetical protein A4V00_11765 [Hungateiclostridiaceae bacterium KB18]ASB42142.1 hypothetical protein ADH66_16615 [Acutalibacter muris]QQR31413.1 hypothetical protein I5Q82_07000 [Acutalibacter muris]
MNITPIANNIKNYGPGSKVTISEEALEKLETSIREGRFDSFQPGEDYGIRQLEELDEDIIGRVLGKPQLSTTFTNSQVSEKARELSMLMDERDDALRSQLKEFSLTISRDQLAEHFGEVGRKIDEAFSEGSITRQEYEDLNAGLKKYTETVTAREERRAAVQEVLRGNAKAMDAMMRRGASQKEIEEFAKWNRETLSDRIDELVKKSKEYDRELMAALIERVRGGEDILKPEEKGEPG